MHLRLIAPHSFLLFCLLLNFSESQAAYGNYRTVLIGHEAAGMGGAYTAMVGDTAGASFYNPATLSRMQGASFSAAANAFQKIKTEFGQNGDFLESPRRLNEGFFVPLPASTGAVVSFGHFALGVSLLIPDFDTFNGEIESTTDATSILNFTDESLWVGTSFALNFTPSLSLGLSTYYTARSFDRSVSDTSTTAGVTTITNEEKTFTNNSVVFILGAYQQLGPRWSLGLSWQLPSIEVSGRGTFFKTTVTSNSNDIEQISNTKISSETRIPGRLTLGLAYRTPAFDISFDVSRHFREQYQDLELEEAADDIEHQAITNLALGSDIRLAKWASLRMGVFTNFSSHPKIGTVSGQRRGDHVDMLGFSSHLSFKTSLHSSLSVGGYYSGGRGESVQQISQQLQVIPQSRDVFTLLIATSFSL